jgi:hypothetical protein
MPVDETFSGLTFGYNPPLLANRVYDIVTAVAYARQSMKAKNVYLVGFRSAGSWAVLASALCGNNVTRTAADLDQFRFEKVTSSKDEMMLPGALKYGGIPAFLALCAPREVLAHNSNGCGSFTTTNAAYKATGAEKAFDLHGEKLEAGEIIQWLLR